MKRLIGLFVAFALCFSFIGASAAMPDELSKVLTEEKYNFTCSAEIKLSDAEFKSLADFIKELAGEDYKKFECFADMELLLESIFTSGAKINMQADLSEDFKKMNVGITCEFDTYVNPNENLLVTAKSKAGMWIEFDIAGEKPVYRMILKAPWFSKLAVIDLFAMMEEEDKAAFTEAYGQYKNIYSEDLIEKANSAMLEKIDKYSEIKKSGSKYTIKIDNNGFVSMLKDIIEIMLDLMVEISPEAFDEDPAVAKAMVDLVKQAIPSLNGMKFLGDEGVTIEYTLSQGNIKTIAESDDIRIDIPSLFETLGMEWGFEARPVLAFKINAESEYSLYGKTVVDFPVLTEENSFDLMEFAMGGIEEEDNYTEEYVPEYPLWYFYFETGKVITEGEKIYVPLRLTLESAYEGNIELAYDNGVITVTSEYFKDYDKMIFSVGSGEISVGDKTVNTDAVIMEEGVTYISCDALSELFNWEIEYAGYDLVNKVYYFSFWEWEDYQEDEFAA